MISLFADNSNRILGLCFDDMTGNTGWLTVEDSALTTHTGVEINEMFNHLSNGNGIPIFKFVNGFAENRTPEEIAADEAEIPVDDSVDPSIALNEIMEVLNDDTAGT